MWQVAFFLKKNTPDFKVETRNKYDSYVDTFSCGQAFLQFLIKLLEK